jgi:hypothetical protein
MTAPASRSVMPRSATLKPSSSVTHNDISAKHLLAPWFCHFNRRNLHDGSYLIWSAIECATVTYHQLAAGAISDRRRPASEPSRHR